MDEFKKKYNELIAREKKAEEYFKTHDDGKYVPAYLELMKDLSTLINAYKIITGVEMSKSEVAEGFKI